MARQTGLSKDEAKTFLDELFCNLGTPDVIAKQIDEMLFDWLLTNRQDFGDWHKERLYTLKSLRDALHSLTGKA